MKSKIYPKKIRNDLKKWTKRPDVEEFLEDSPTQTPFVSHHKPESHTNSIHGVSEDGEDLTLGVFSTDHNRVIKYSPPEWT
jgi:hypothetical protein